MLNIFNIKQRKEIKQGYKLLKYYKCQYCSDRDKAVCRFCPELLMQIKGREHYIDEIERENAEFEDGAGI